MSQSQKTLYNKAFEDWKNARKELKYTLDFIAGKMMMKEGNYEAELESAYERYKPTAEKYLRALEAYISRTSQSEIKYLIKQHLNEAAKAQQFGRDDVSDKLVKQSKVLVVEIVKLAYQNWFRNGTKDTMAAFFSAYGDTQALGVVDEDVEKKYREVWDVYSQGKWARQF